ncbi:hypothetical protein B2J93_6000 [Marssonina coronariae]|uniref:Uncharacterized protein n=1 Tax=Diplocarpon coronariae TaxID=2795749 RepID=A0A218Z8F0_9HELO|nr:hypothetical protein B2J93_6000 [Marssonina coronariae]
MSSRFLLQKPYVAATLPQSIDHTNTNYVVAEVYGGAPGAKKRKRSELAVGVDGEGIGLEAYNFLCASSTFDFYLSSNITQDPNIEK